LVGLPSCSLYLGDSGEDLLSVGYKSEVACFDGLIPATLNSDQVYDLVILCSSLPPKDRDLIMVALSDKEVTVYPVQRLTDPDRFLSDIKTLLRSYE
jgi:hypothetical protein